MMGWGVVIFLFGLGCIFIGISALVNGNIKAVPIIIMGFVVMILAARLDVRGVKSDD